MFLEILKLSGAALRLAHQLMGFLLHFVDRVNVACQYGGNGEMPDRWEHADQLDQSSTPLGNKW